MEGSQYLSSVEEGDEPDGEILDGLKATLHQLLRCEEVFPDEQDPDEPLSPVMSRKTSRYPPTAPKKGRRLDPIDLDLDDDVAAQRLAFVGQKEPASARKRQRSPEDDMVPDLGTYFAQFEDCPEPEQVKICRAFANYLSAKDARNRVRWSDKANKSGTWQKRVL